MDRNTKTKSVTNCDNVSLSVRRAWIEIRAVLREHGKSLVALRKESVDRNDA